MTYDVADLVEQLSSQDVQLQRSAAMKLINTPDASTAVVELVISAGSDDETLVENASAALEEIRSISNEQAERLVQILKQKDSEFASNVIYWIATLLGRIESRSAPFVDDLINAAQTVQESFVKDRIVWAIGEVGPQAQAAKPILKEFSTGKNQRLARLATNALEKLQAT